MHCRNGSRDAIGGVICHSEAPALSVLLGRNPRICPSGISLKRIALLGVAVLSIPKSYYLAMLTCSHKAHI